MPLELYLFFLLENFVYFAEFSLAHEIRFLRYNGLNMQLDSFRR